jgi:hypothetical protein
VRRDEQPPVRNLPDPMVWQRSCVRRCLKRQRGARVRGSIGLGLGQRGGAEGPKLGEGRLAERACGWSGRGIGG